VSPEGVQGSKTLHTVRTSIWWSLRLLLRRAMQQQCLREIRDQTLIIWSTLCYTARSAVKGASDQLIKRGAMVLTRYRHVEFDILNQHWLRTVGYVYNNWTSLICTFSVVYGLSELMQRILIYGDRQNTNVLSDKELNTFVYGTLSYVIIFRSCKL